MVDGPPPHVGSLRIDAIHTPGHTEVHFTFDDLNGRGAPVAPSTLLATSRPYIDSSVSWNVARVFCTLTE